MWAGEKVRAPTELDLDGGQPLHGILFIYLPVPATHQRNTICVKDLVAARASKSSIFFCIAVSRLAG